MISGAITSQYLLEKSRIVFQVSQALLSPAGYWAPLVSVDEWAWWLRGYVKAEVMSRFVSEHGACSLPPSIATLSFGYIGSSAPVI